MKSLTKIIIISIAIMVSIRLIVMLIDRIEEKRERQIFRDIEKKEKGGERI